MSLQIRAVVQFIPEVISGRKRGVELWVLVGWLIVVEYIGLLVLVVVYGALAEGSLVIHLGNQGLILVMVLQLCQAISCHFDNIDLWVASVVVLILMALRSLECVLEVLAEGLPHRPLHEHRVGRIHVVSPIWWLGTGLGLVVKVCWCEPVNEVLQLCVLHWTQLWWGRLFLELQIVQNLLLRWITNGNNWVVFAFVLLFVEVALGGWKLVAWDHGLLLLVEDLDLR